MIYTRISSSYFPFIPYYVEDIAIRHFESLGTFARVSKRTIELFLLFSLDLCFATFTYVLIFFSFLRYWYPCGCAVSIGRSLFAWLPESLVF